MREELAAARAVGRTRRAGIAGCDRMRVAQLDPRRHQGAITDREFAKFSEEALALAKAKPLVIDYDDPEFTGPGERLGSTEYEAFVAGGDADFAWKMPDDEWDAISLNYTSGRPQRRGLPSSRGLSAGAGQRRELRDAKASGVFVDAADVPLQRLVLSVVNLSLAVEGWSDKIDWHLSFAGEAVHSRGDGSRQLPSEQLRQRVLRRGGSIESILGLLTESLYKSEHRQRVVAASLQ